MDVDESGSSTEDYRPSSHSPAPIVKKERHKSLSSDDLPLEAGVARIEASKKTRKDWLEPEPTGEVHEPPCTHCAKKNIRCQKERAAGASTSPVNKRAIRL
jgi:hypothetical protein